MGSGLLNNFLPGVSICGLPSPSSCVHYLQILYIINESDFWSSPSPLPDWHVIIDFFVESRSPNLITWPIYSSLLSLIVFTTSGLLYSRYNSKLYLLCLFSLMPLCILRRIFPSKILNASSFLLITVLVSGA